MGKIKLIDIINESTRDMFEGFNEAELTEDYPQNFDLNRFKKIHSYAGKLRYAQEYLGKPIGNGSSRVVYRVDNNKVLKLAKNKKGIAQNEAESKWANDYYFSDILAQVLAYDEDTNLWTEMELAYRPKKSDFQRLWGIKFDDMDVYLMNTELINNGKGGLWRIEPEIKEQLDNNEHVSQVVDFMINSNSSPHDLGKINSWGLVKRTEGECLVIVDFGLTHAVYASYYS